MTIATAKALESDKDRWGSRLASLVVAGLISLVLILDPYLLNNVPMTRLHEGLPVLMLGASSAFAHGLGFRPASREIRILFHPVAAWALLALGAALIFFR